MVTRYRATVDEYLALPEEPPYLEYVDGEILQKAMPDWDHGQLVKQLTLWSWRYDQQAGGNSGPEIRVQFTTERGKQYRLPDYGYWAPGRPRRAGKFAAPPTLAVEIRSPDEPMRDQREKCRYYRANGVDAAWLVDPESRTIEVFDADRDGVALREDDTLESPALPGFALPLKELFAVLDQE